jgi:hypothetical protein
VLAVACDRLFDEDAEEDPSQPSEAHLQEERRLCSIAWTRASEGLYLTYFRYGDPRGHTQLQQPSRFLACVDAPTVRWCRENSETDEECAEHLLEHEDEGICASADEVDASLVVPASRRCAHYSCNSNTPQAHRRITSTSHIIPSRSIPYVPPIGIDLFRPTGYYVTYTGYAPVGLTSEWVAPDLFSDLVCLIAGRLR